MPREKSGASPWAKRKTTKLTHDPVWQFVALPDAKGGLQDFESAALTFNPTTGEPNYFNRIAGSPSNTQVRRMSVFVTAAFALVAASPMVTAVPPNNCR